MNKKFIISISIIVLVIVVAFIIYFASSGTSCENITDKECFVKHFEKCQSDFISVQGETFDGFRFPVGFSMEILRKEGRNCVVNYTITNVSYPGETWVIGKSAECYLPYKNPQEYLNKDLITQYSENCEGSLAEGIKDNCYVSGSSTSGGVTKKTYSCDIPEEEPVFVTNVTLDPESICDKINDNYNDKVVCVKYMQVIYDAITISSSLCERTDYASDRENCEEIASKYTSYTKWYHDTLIEYEAQGVI